MNRWAVRIAGMVMLLLFALVFMQMRSTLVRLQHQQQRNAR